MMTSAMRFHRYIQFWMLLILLFVPSMAESAAFIWPCNGTITSEFGWRTHPIYGTSKFHSGIDIGVDYGTPIHAAAAGLVTYSGWISGYGETVIIKHPGGFETLYGHNQSRTVVEEQGVVQGQVIAYAGSTGNSTGPHCHFEVLLNGEPVNPGDYLDGGPASSGDFALGEASPSVQMQFNKEHDFSGPLHEVVETFAKYLVEGFKRIKDVMQKFLAIILVIDLSVAATFYAINPRFNEGEQGIFGFLLHKLLLYGILIWLVTSWSSILGDASRDFALYTSGYALNAGEEEIRRLVQDPFDILVKGLSMIAPLFEHSVLLAGAAGLAHPAGVVSFVILIGCGLLLAIFFFLIAANIAMAYLSFYASVLFGFCTFFFAGSKHMRHHAEQGLNGIFYATIKLFIASFMGFFVLGVVKDMVVDDFVKQELSSTSVVIPVDAQFGGPEDLQRVVNMIANHESHFRYDIYNMTYGGNGKTPDGGDGGYGAWQFTNPGFPAWAEECEDAMGTGYLSRLSQGAIEPGNSPNKLIPQGYSLPYGTTDFAYSPENQRKVAAFKIKQYYDEAHDWNKVIARWNGGDPDYVNKVLASARSAKISAPPVATVVIDYYIIFKLTILCLVFVYMFSRLNSSIETLCGGNGFRFTVRDFE